jgi:hypothetical protein
MSHFELYIGIDYSGAETPTSRLKALQVYAARPGGLPEKQLSPARTRNGQPANWTRAEIAGWLIALARQGVCFIAGIDHAFSFPSSYFERYGLTTWEQFLDDFVDHWPTDSEHVYVDSIRMGMPFDEEGPAPGARIGQPNELRLSERWTSSAKSVFQFDIQGSVAKSSHAGIPWLKRIREAVGERVHFWPYDGWTPTKGKSVIAEVYPSILRNRYPREGRWSDEQDAYAVSRWLSETAARGALDRYMEPPLTREERLVADREGWILGIT